MNADDIARVATWPLVIEALRAGHRRARARVADSFVGEGENTMLVRSAWVPGVAAGVKAATVVPDNGKRELPSVHAHVMLFDPLDGRLTATVDGTSLTAWKTAGDSALGADLLARDDAKTLVMVGAGAMAQPLIEAHRFVRPSIERVIVWNRSRDKAEALAADVGGEIADSLEDAVGTADVVCCATMALEPIVRGAWLKPGAHLDLVGAFKADMREADDEALRRGHVFVDCRDTTIGHIGEIDIPLAAGVITRADILGDLYDPIVRASEDAITVFKNGGGAHLDVMVAKALVDAA